MGLHLFSSQKFDLVVVGGGAAGFMAAITAAERGIGSILLLEANINPLQKVRISGGGRCNVTHACWEPKELILNYPRGQKTLLGSFSKFASGDAVSWFAERGVNLKVEKDGRMFPESNSSQEIIECLRKTAKDNGVIVQTNMPVLKIESLEENGFLLNCIKDISFISKLILLATGSHPSGRKIAKELGHNIVFPVPSLFSFRLANIPITSCSGLALDDIKLKLITTKKKFIEKGRVLITHCGFSGPVVLKLSAFAARNLHLDNYKAKLIINWLDLEPEDIKSIFMSIRDHKGFKSLVSLKPFPSLPKSLWINFLEQSNILPSVRWADLKSIDINYLSRALTQNEYLIQSRGPYGEEFVTAGGVDLRDINMSTMESIKIKGLFFAGELMDIDGVTGGFNFQHCWTSGWIAGVSIAEKMVS